MKILLVGGCGYVGGYLTDRLIHCMHDVTVYDNLTYESRFLKSVNFIYGDIRSEVFEHMQFDSIVFAASIQYFPSLTEIISNTIKLLKHQGEIHILDSHFYNQDTSVSAKKKDKRILQSFRLSRNGGSLFSSLSQRPQSI